MEGYDGRKGRREGKEAWGGEELRLASGMATSGVICIIHDVIALYPSPTSHVHVRRRASLREDWLVRE
jgi:hypothetical protein